VQEVFGVLIFVVVAAGAVAAVISMLHSGSAYDEIGRGGLYHPAAREPAPPAAADDEEIREMLTARNARRAARGQAPLDVDRELRELLRPAPDPELEAEVRALAQSRNRRRAARGQAPLDVDAEVARRLRDAR
jgi:hypothetical protein